MNITNYAKYSLLGFAAFYVLSAPLSFALDTTSAAQHGQMVNGESKKMCHKKDWKQHKADFAKKLNLTQAQQDALKAKRESFRVANKAQLDAMRQQHEALRGYFKAGKGKTPEAIALKKQLNEERKAIHQQHLAMMQSVLTPEQMVQFTQMKSEWQSKHKNAKPCKRTQTKES